MTVSRWLSGRRRSISTVACKSASAVRAGAIRRTGVCATPAGRSRPPSCVVVGSAWQSQRDSNQRPAAAWACATSPILVDCAENLIQVGQVKMGLPSIAMVGIFMNPMLEVMPRILRERSIGQLPLLPYSAMLASSAIWGCYGLLTHNPAIWSPNLFGVVLGATYCLVYWRFCPAHANWLPYTLRYHFFYVSAVFSFCGGVALVLPESSSAIVLGLAGNLMSLCLFGGPLVAVSTVLKERSTRSLPFGFACMVASNTLMWCLYGYFILDDPLIYVTNTLGMILATAQLSLFWRFGIHR